MKRIIIEGNRPLSGKIKIGGAKNSVVALIPASIMADGIVHINNVPNISDKDALVEIIDTILENNPKQIEDYKNGRTNLFDYFVGQVMKETRVKANPVITKEILKEKL